MAPVAGNPKVSSEDGNIHRNESALPNAAELADDVCPARVSDPTPSSASTLSSEIPNSIRPPFPSQQYFPFQVNQGNPVYPPHQPYFVYPHPSQSPFPNQSHPKILPSNHRTVPSSSVPETLEPPKSRKESRAQKGKQPGPKTKRKAKAKDKAPSVKRKLSHEDSLLIISFWRENYEEYYKSNKKSFAKKSAEKLNRIHLHTSDDQPPLGVDQLERLLSYWLDRYKKVADQFKDSGYGLTEEDPDSLKAVAEQKFKYFWELHEFLPCRANVNPPFLLQPRQDGRRSRLDVEGDYGKLGLPNTGAAEVELDAEDEEEGDMLDLVQHTETIVPSDSREPRSISQKRRFPSLPARSGEDSAHNIRRTSKETQSKKRRLSSGSLVVVDDTAPRRENQRESASKSQGGSEKEGRNSNSRLKMMSDVLASQVTVNEAQNESFAKTVSVIEKEAGIREKEVSIMEQETSLRLKESGLLEREQERKDREEILRQKEEQRKEKEELRKEREDLRKSISLKRKMIMEEAEQLRQQASMYMNLNLRNEALDSMKRSESLVKKLGEIHDENES